MIGGAALCEKPRVELGGDGPDFLKTKEEIVKFARDSIASLHKAAMSVNDHIRTNAFKNPLGKGSTTRRAMSASAISPPWIITGIWSSNCG
jgi:hypothetical protein